MAKLPPVRKRQHYGDITSDDLVFALFWDRLLGDRGAMREDREMAPIVATKTLNELRITLKHGKHDQRSHGRRGARGRAAASTYQAARAGGATHAEARAAANNVSRAISVRQRYANVSTQLGGYTSERQRSSLQAEQRRLESELGRLTSQMNDEQLTAVVGADIRSTVMGRRAPAKAAPIKPARKPRVKQDPQAKARAFEDKIRAQRFESAMAVDGNGKPILKKDGGYDFVSFSDAEIASVRSAKGVVFTHNHPLGWEVPPSDPRHNGNSFSGADIRMAAMMDVAEMRAVTPTRRYYVKAPPGGWNEQYHRERIQPLYDTYNRQVRQDFTRRINEGRMSTAEAEAFHSHTVWAQVFGNLGIEYGYTED